MNNKIVTLLQQCDDLAARHWQLEASGRGQSYLEWLQKVKQVSDIIEENEDNILYFFRYRKKPALNLASRGEGRGKSSKSRGAVEEKID